MIDVSWKKNAGEGGEGMSSNEGQKAEAKQSFWSVRLDTIARQLGRCRFSQLQFGVWGPSSMLSHTLLLIFLFFPLVISHDTRPYELTIHRCIHTRRCTIVRTRRIPRHRRLSGEHHAVGFSRILFTRDRDRAVEQVTVFATDTTSLQHHFSHICPDADNTLPEEFPLAAISASQQHPLAKASEDPGSPEGIIPLEVTEITVSGPSSNRVDVTFFSDGCKCPIATWANSYSAATSSNLTHPLSHLAPI